MHFVITVYYTNYNKLINNIINQAMETKSYRQLLAQRCVTKLQITLLLTENVHHNQMVREHS